MRVRVHHGVLPLLDLLLHGAAVSPVRQAGVMLGMVRNGGL